MNMPSIKTILTTVAIIAVVFRVSPVRKIVVGQ